MDSAPYWDKDLAKIVVLRASKVTSNPVSREGVPANTRRSGRFCHAAPPKNGGIVRRTGEPAGCLASFEAHRV